MGRDKALTASFCEQAENIGYVIPPVIFEHFLEDFRRNGRYVGFPALGVEWQKLENPAMRRALGMGSAQKGVLIRRVEQAAPAAAVLKAGDVLLSFNGTEIGTDGSIQFRRGERICFSHVVSSLFCGEEATIRVLSQPAGPGGDAAAVVRELRVKMYAPSRLVPVHTRGLPPSYFICAGLVFTPVSVP